MSDSPASQRKTVWSIVTAVMLLLSAYVGGYFALGKHMSGTVLHYNTGETSTQHHRCFQHSPLVTIYYPMGWIECRVRSERVVLIAINEDALAVTQEHSFEPPR